MTTPPRQHRAAWRDWSFWVISDRVRPRHPLAVSDQVARLAHALRLKDVLVLERRGDLLRLQGGFGRGAGWAGTVEIDAAQEPLVKKATPNQPPVRVAAGVPRHIIGPYWSRHAAVVAVGSDQLVVVGADEPIRVSDGELRRNAAEAVSAVGGVPSSKLLADELEVVDAVRQLMHYRPESMSATARHIADVAAAVLSCEFSAVLAYGPGGPVAEQADAAQKERQDLQLCTEMQRLERRVDGEPLLEQEVNEDGRFGRDAGLVSRYVLPLGGASRGGILVVGHAAERARGFTLLCQRVGQAIADAADVLLSQAAAREELSAERDRFEREARTDDLTGLANRVAWSEAVSAETFRRGRYGHPLVVMSMDVDGLKEANDRYGHSAGDELLVATATILRRILRETDVIARVGGDEFGALLPETTGSTMDRITDRVRAACEEWRGSMDDLRLSLSIGWASPQPEDEDLAAALQTADELMYRAKREFSV
jgi:diguanylate cyclase (GGDEF)-like protein